MSTYAFSNVCKSGYDVWEDKMSRALSYRSTYFSRRLIP